MNIPPGQGTFKGQSGYAEVFITYTQPRLQCAVGQPAPLTVTVCLVARGTYLTQAGYAVLVPTRMAREAFKWVISKAAEAS